MKIVTIIPARLGSSRFPGKPLALINGKPMIGHVFERVRRAKGIDATIVATCDIEIKDYIESIGGTAIMTSKKHERASDRCAEALEAFESESGKRFDIIVMVQGDEPMTVPEMVEEAIQPFFTDNDVNVVNLYSKIRTTEEFEDRNCIKVLLDLNNNALCFSREPIPTRRFSNEIPCNKQVCVIPFKSEFLKHYNTLEPTTLEVVESVDMMRVLENGYKVKMVETTHVTFAVDTPEDLKKVQELMPQ